MSKLLLIILLITSDFDYQKIFGSDYQDALKFCKQNKVAIRNMSAKYQTDTAVVVSMIFPELIRYSLFKDFFETAALELVYVNYGEKYADFSIGQFQMKPSFVEKLEKYLKQSSLKVKYPNICQYNSTSESQIRQERVQRLKFLDWQLIYVNCLYDVVSEKFKNIIWKSKEEKINHYELKARSIKTAG